jgi:large conductance mechanosensitive channel
MKNFFKEFKEFISRGNVIDLAVAVIIGAAFGKIVSSLVEDIIMPLLGIIVGKNFSDLYVDINGSPLMYGKFIQAIIDFLIVAFCIFVFTKIINTVKKKVDAKIKRDEEKDKEKPKKSDDVILLEEIRDLLKKEKSSK